MSKTQVSQKPRSPKPSWLKVRFPSGPQYSWIKDQARTRSLSTVCEEARCPNIGECWNGGTATFMLMGDTCTRGCRFCAVKTARRPMPLDFDEPQKLAETIRQMQLKYVVITTVNRDELPDQGSSHIARSIAAVQAANPELLIEILMPDFQGEEPLVQKVLDANPAVAAHNVETVKRLTSKVRDPRAGYTQSLDVLRYAKTSRPDIYTKSSLMLGVGETKEEVIQAMEDLRRVDVDFLTLGQYLQPDRTKLPVESYIPPDAFQEYEQLGQSMGFQYVASGPLVRSSYRAAEFYIHRHISNASTAS